MANLNLKKLGLPKDVLVNSGENIELHGKLKGDTNEIVVLMQNGRTIKEAFVCHISKGYISRTKAETANLVLDIPNFPKLVITDDMMDISVKKYKGVKYTMACITEKDLVSSMALWLH